MNSRKYAIVHRLLRSLGPLGEYDESRLDETIHNLVGLREPYHLTWHTLRNIWQQNLPQPRISLIRHICEGM